MKSQPITWEKIFANDITNKWLISKIYKQFIQQFKKNQEKDGQKTYIDIFPKKIYKWPRGT